ncbi:hypothetical protein J7T55_012001 [Diaporthe amygdali]|uniref:uncharacterized protein n=1 Tax=Phomopsis amygdali TaxID=1214568 RepID=UPI0022FEF586|nr:uncharacterized protein J7T55_012001 [Diaporthe amygdali]KAJ0123536.1 hypothetical protein J7T55_012001 [Diaporthe amygdali]
MSANPEDVEVLVDAIKNRQKFPRPCVKAYDRLGETASETTERIFFDTGGVSAWAAYVLTKRASESTAHVSGRSRRRQLLARIEASTTNARRELATRLAAALEPDRERVEQLVRVAQQQPDRARRSGRQSRDGSTATRQTPEDGSEGDSLRPQGGQEIQEGSSPSRNQIAPPAFGALPIFTKAPVAGCRRLFPPYLAASIKRDNDHFAVVSMLPTSTAQSSEYLLKLEITEDTVGYIAMELFGAHLEAKGGWRYVYLMGTTRVAPRPALLLQGCRDTATIVSSPLDRGTSRSFSNHRRPQSLVAGLGSDGRRDISVTQEEEALACTPAVDFATGTLHKRGDL